ncbi:uncharacterized protein LOC126101456 [Schistocerca cancellata]|uniref:uncharacterized protein LOC126101456 n=1 Tax=Schistocerca cancellata TaxID=274614 RepID=UPI0021177637|nr:uncharacterized protein LOC126101456 [Schistocerca cancellata]
MEMKMLRWSMGLKQCDHVKNTEFRQRFGVAPIADKVREVRLRWYDHVKRKQDNSVAKTALHINPGGTRPPGRPAKRWTDNVRGDMHDVGLRPEDVNDREKWRRCNKTEDPASRD